MKNSVINVVNKSLTKVLSSNLLAEAPKYVNTFNKDTIYQKVGALNRWYTKIIGLDEVKLYQDRVVNLQEKLLSAQERRRELGGLLEVVRRKSNELQDQIIKVKRDDYETFLSLIKEETIVLKEEQEVARTFAVCDQEEREIFTAFSNAIRDSHEKQRAQLEYTKYFGLIISVTGSFLAFVYSTLKKNDLKQFIEKNLEAATINSLSSSDISFPIKRDLDENKKNINELYKRIVHIDEDNKNIMHIINNNHREISNLISKTSFKNEMGSYIQESTKNLNEIPTGNILWYTAVCIVGLWILGRIAG